jgi:FAD binding domain
MTTWATPTLPLGRVLDDSHTDWDLARRAWNLSHDQRPALVAQPADAHEVAEIVQFAAQNGLRVAPQATGHNPGPFGDLSNTILLRTDLMKEVTLDRDARIVRVGAGVVWGEVTRVLAPFGLTALAGSSHDVGVVGLTLGGGYSWLAREHGLSASKVTAVEVVTGDGEFIRADAEHEPELFWAVRGGGANIGVVTALEFEVLELAEIYAGMMLFPYERAEEVLRTYNAWTKGLDPRATTAIRLMNIPPMPNLPPFLSGQSLVVVDGAIDAPKDEADAIIAPLRNLGPTMDTFAIMPTGALDQIHMDPPEPVPGTGDGYTLLDLDDKTIDALLAVVGPGVSHPLLSVELRHLEGAISQPDPHAGAVDSLPGRFLGYSVGITPVPQAVPPVIAAVTAVRTALEPWAGTRNYANFRDSSDAPERFWDASVLERLRAARDRYNANRTIRGNHELG